MQTRNKGILVLVFLMAAFLHPSILKGDADEMVAKYRELPLSIPNADFLLSTLEKERKQLETELKTKYPDKPEKVAQNGDLAGYMWAISETNRVRAAMGKGPEDQLLRAAFQRIQRMHYSLLADLGKGGEGSSIINGAKFVVHVVGGNLGLSVPNVILPEQPIGKRLAQLESPNLFRANGTGPVSPDEMAKMSAFEVSRLKPSPNHLAFKDIDPGNHFEVFLKEMTTLIRMQGGKLAQFDFSFARKILFVDELKDDATSPKISAKDRYGMKWKLKWGDEVHAAVALERLFIDLGTTYEDQMFYSGPGETILVLAAPGDKDPKAIRTFDQLATMLKKSRFRFHALRYLLPGSVVSDKNGKVLGSGLVDAVMAEQQGLDFKYVGAFYVKFKECQLSFYNPAIKRLGALPMSRLGSVEDRVYRSSMVLNAWVKNRDVKDDNSRIGLVFNPETKRFDRMVEFQSDLGTAMGSLIAGGELNSVERSMILQMPQSYNFNLRPLYLPRSWKACSWADARWMALRIAKLSREDIERAFLDCGWPVFAQRVAVERLVSRRNELVKIFKLEADGIKALPCDTHFSMADPKSGDEPVRNGNINGRSRIVKELRETIHPEGLDRILNRFLD